MLGSLNKMTNTFALKISKNVLAQNAAFVICFWKVKESTLVEIHIMRGALSALIVGKRDIDLIKVMRVVVFFDGDSKIHRKKARVPLQGLNSYIVQPSDS